MKRMTKLTSVLLAVLMLLSMMVPMVSAAEYSDVPSTHKYYKAITDLSVYGILNGFEDGTFRPEEGVTRAQFAKIICFALNVGGLTTSGPVDTGFTDVDPNHWAAANIKMAASMGIINGMGDGTFQPESPVLYEQAVKMVVCALGYSNSAEANGGYPYGHMTVAANINVLKNSDGVFGQGANRGTIANLVNNMLSAEQVTSTGEKGQSLKEQSIKTIALDGQVTAVYGLTIYANTVSPCQRNQIQLLAADGQHYTFSVADLNNVKNSVADYLGRRVTVYYSADDDLRSPILTNLTLQANRNDTQEVDLADIINYIDTEIEYMSDYTFGDTDTVSVSSSAKILYNGVATATNLAALIDPTRSGQILFLDSDSDSDADVVFIKEYTTMIVKSKATTTYKLNDEDVFTGTKNELVLDPNDSSKTITIKKNGSVAEFKDIAVGDVVSFARSINGNIIDVLVSNKTAASASISAYNTSRGLVTLRVSGKDTEYKLSSDFAKYTNTTLEVGMTGKFFIDAFGKIAKADLKSDTSYTYAYLKGYQNQGSLATPEHQIQVILLDGKTSAENKVVKFANKFKIDGESFTDSSDPTSVETALVNAALTFNSASSFVADENTKYCQVIKYSTNAAGKIDRIITADSIDASNKLNIDNTYLTTGASCTTNGRTLENILDISKAKVLLVPEARIEDSTNKFKGYGASYFTTGTHKYKVQLIDKTTGDDVPYVISYGTIGVAADRSWLDIAPAVVQKKEITYDQTNEVERILLTVLTSDGETVKYYEGEDTVGNVSSVVVGDVVRIDGEANGEIEEIKAVVSLADMIAASATPGEDIDSSTTTGTSAQYRRIIGTATRTTEDTLFLKQAFVTGDPATLSGTEERFSISGTKFVVVDSAKASVEATQDNAVAFASVGDVEGFDDYNQTPDASKILLYSKSGSVKLVVIFK